MAATISELAGSSEQLVKLAADLDAGAHEGMQRNTHLRDLALENRAPSRRQHAVTRARSPPTSRQAPRRSSSSRGVGRGAQLRDARAEARPPVQAARAQRGDGSGARRRARSRLRGRRRRGASPGGDVVGRRGEDGARGDRRVAAASRSRAASSERTVETVRDVRGATEHGSRSFGQIENAVADGRGVDDVDRSRRADGQRRSSREMRVRARLARQRHRIVRRGDGRSGRVERGAEREHGADRRRRGHARRRRRSSAVHRRESAPRRHRRAGTAHVSTGRAAAHVRSGGTCGAHIRSVEQVARPSGPTKAPARLRTHESPAHFGTTHAAPIRRDHCGSASVGLEPHRPPVRPNEAAA